MTAIRIPSGLAESCARDADRRAWLEGLPRLIAELEKRWRLTIGDCFSSDEGTCAWVAPVTQPGDRHAVLKVAMPHMEGAGEIAGLRFWNGDGMVRLLEADERSGAMLLERCVPGTSLGALPEPEQDVVLADLLRHLWRNAPTERLFRPLSDMLAAWSDETRAALERLPDRGLASAGVQLFAELPSTADRDVVLLTDLHAGNVLRAERAPWLAIDPKPFVGDPAYDATQHLFNCLGRMQSDPLGTIRRFSDLLEVPVERVRLWMFARCAAEVREGYAHNPWPAVARRIAP